MLSASIAASTLAMALVNLLESDVLLSTDEKARIRSDMVDALHQDLALGRHAYFELQRRRLEHHFEGEVVDTERSLGDVFFLPGHYIAKADIRVFTVVPTDENKIPVVAVVAYHYFNYPFLSGATSPLGLHTGIVAKIDMILLKTLIHIDGWRDPRFARCLIFIKFTDLHGFHHSDRGSGAVEDVTVGPTQWWL